MFSMRIFLSYSMHEEDSIIANCIRQIITNQHCEVVTGEGTPVGLSLPEGVKRLIRECHATVCVATVRSQNQYTDGSYSFPEWIRRELIYAHECQLPIIPVIEAGVRTSELKILGDDVKYIEFKRSDLVSLLLTVSKAIHDLQGPPLYQNPVLAMQARGKYVERWGQDVGELLEAAITCIKYKAFLDARKLLQDAIMKNPGCWTAYINMGTSYAEAGEPDQAKAWYTKVIEQCDDDDSRARAYHDLGVVMSLVNGNHDPERIWERLKLFQKALELKSDRINTRYSMFLDYANLGEFDKAAEIFNGSLGYEGFVDHIRRFLSQEPPDILRKIALHLDPRIINIVFPERSKEKEKEKEKEKKKEKSDEIS